jgi:hypothetical protein
MSRLFLLFVIAISACSTAPHISPANAEIEKIEIGYDISDLNETKAVLESLLVKYDLKKYIFTRKINLQTMAIPHSHPVLTMNTRERKRPDFLLATLLHEQMHWYLDSRPEETNHILAQLKQQYVKIPRGFPQASEEDESTYLHLLVNWLELKALEDIIGGTEARKVLGGKDYYIWIYKTVLKDEEKIGSIIKSSKLEILNH